MKRRFLTLKVFNATLLFLFTIAFFSFKMKTKETKKADYNVTIINKYWNSLHLQVRVGNQSVPENNSLVKDVILKKNESVSVDYDVLCYYRRDADPDHPDGVNFTTWTGAGCFRDKPCVVDNP